MVTNYHMIGWMKLFFIKFQLVYDSYDKKGWLLPTCYEAIETMKQQTKKKIQIVTMHQQINFKVKLKFIFSYMIFK